MTYETREAWLNAFADTARTNFSALAGVEIPYNLRVSVGYPPNSRAKKGGKVISVWISPEASADGHHEIFISPDNATDVDLAATLTHELVHAVHGGAEGHGKRFGATARALGLDGPLTATHAGESWFSWAMPILETLGAAPYAAIDLSKSNRPKKKTYLAKLDCPSCGWTAQISRCHVEAHDYLSCPVPDCDGTLHYHGNDEDSAEG